MVFSSLIFLNLFLPAFFAVYFLVPSSRTRLRNAVILLFSLFFYAWGEWEVTWWMLTCIVINWGAGILLERITGDRSRRVILWAAVIASLGILAYFKYANFFVENVNDSFIWLFGYEDEVIRDMWRVALPVGISFYTFQALSYTVDVYTRQVKATRSLLDFACYVSMFSQLIAGPIIRYHDIADELTQRRVTQELFVSGIKRFIVGLGKKMIVANVMASTADNIFALPDNQISPALAWVAVAAYTLQIYYDFSAYSDMAIGLGRMMGFTFPENFRHPYAAKSIRDFWRRWHISLSTWFRDYVYLPLGGNRGSAMRTYINLWLVFLLCGLWHGASWTFIIWGAFHGGFLVLERTGFSSVLQRAPQVVRHAYVILVVMTGWTLFRADTLEQATVFMRAMFGMNDAVSVIRPVAEFAGPFALLIFIIGAVGATGVPTRWFFSAQRFFENGKTVSTFVAGESMVALLSVVVAVISVMFLANGSYNPFIYFRF